jgi:hypothetical protein
MEQRWTLKYKQPAAGECPAPVQIQLLTDPIFSFWSTGAYQLLNLVEDWLGVVLLDMRERMEFGCFSSKSLTSKEVRVGVFLCQAGESREVA